MWLLKTINDGEANVLFAQFVENLGCMVITDMAFDKQVAVVILLTINYVRLLPSTTFSLNKLLTQHSVDFFYQGLITAILCSQAGLHTFTNLRKCRTLLHKAKKQDHLTLLHLYALAAFVLMFSTSHLHSALISEKALFLLTSFPLNPNQNPSLCLTKIYFYSCH